ncbi:double homeobox protein 4C-like [Erythrolamprus reginae]|uniref:double homeobox protein 4C-like n=1 Tax=Erythrolamprus reginae TaxID=121349 RepID=UPI00396CCDE9
MNRRNSRKWPKIRAARGERRKRTIFTKEQVARLNEAYKINPYPGYEERESLAQELRIPEARVQVWFQNKRARPSPQHAKESSRPSSDPSESRLSPDDVDCLSFTDGLTWADPWPQGGNWTFLGQSQAFQPMEVSQEVAPPTAQYCAPVEPAFSALQGFWDARAPSGSELVPTLPSPPQQHPLLQSPQGAFSYPAYHPQLAGDPFYPSQPCSSSSPDPALGVHGAADLLGPFGLGLAQGSAPHGEAPQPPFYGNEAVNWENWR